MKSSILYKVETAPRNAWHEGVRTKGGQDMVDKNTDSISATNDNFHGFERVRPALSVPRASKAFSPVEITSKTRSSTLVFGSKSDVRRHSSLRRSIASPPRAKLIEQRKKLEERGERETASAQSWARAQGGSDRRTDKRFLKGERILSAEESHVSRQNITKTLPERIFFLLNSWHYGRGHRRPFRDRPG